MTDLEEFDKLINMLTTEEKELFYKYVNILKKFLRNDPKIGLVAFSYVGVCLQNYVDPK